MENEKTISVDAMALQERDEFREQGWTKVIAPAKVNLHLAIGARREDGYHEAATVLHALNLHDTVYMRRTPGGGDGPIARMVGCEGVEPPELASEDNIACKAVRLLAEKTGRTGRAANGDNPADGGLPHPDEIPGNGNETPTAAEAAEYAFASDVALELRIEKRIPAQAGLGGGSSDAAAALVGAARIWGLAPDDPAIEEAARELGADVAFFIHGGCTYLEGTGDTFVASLSPSKRAIALVKPADGVSTAAAYRTFDENPQAIPPAVANRVRAATQAEQVELFNNLAPAAERCLPELAEIRSWLAELPGVEGALLCGSGSCTFAICEDFATASAVVAEARKRDLWARATSFGSCRAMVVGS